MLSTTSDATKLAWIDTSVSTLLSFWRPDDTSVPIPGAIIELLNAPEYEGASADLLRARGDVEFYLWSNFPATLSMGASNMTASGIFGPELPQEDVFTALWRLASLPPKFHSQRPLSTLSTQRESVLNALSNNTDPSCVHISRSVAALLKVVSLDVPADADERGEAPVSWFNRVSGVFPAETANAIRDTDTQVEWSTVRKCIWGRNTEALISTLAEFLEHCASDVLPYKAVETLKRMNHISFPWAVHHSSTQTRRQHPRHLRCGAFCGSVGGGCELLVLAYLCGTAQRPDGAGPVGRPEDPVAR
jgi:hypothetical protein